MPEEVKEHINFWQDTSGRIPKPNKYSVGASFTDSKLKTPSLLVQYCNQQRWSQERKEESRYTAILPLWLICNLCCYWCEQGGPQGCGAREPKCRQHEIHKDATSIHTMFTGRCAVLEILRGDGAQPQRARDLGESDLPIRKEVEDAVPRY